METTKILWMSRHRPLESQKEALNDLFGKVKIEQDPNPFSNADDIVNRYKSGNYDEMVVVAPLSVIAELTKRGIKPLWAEMKQIDPNDENAEVVANGRGYTFICFKRIKTVRMEFEEI